MRCSLLLLVVAGACFLWGVAFVKYQAFPYALLRSVVPVGSSQASRAARLIQEQFVRPVDVVVIGDSLVAQGPWHEMFPSYRVANFGISGDTAEQVAARLSVLSETLACQAVLLFGINDILRDIATSEILSAYAVTLDAVSQAGMQPIVVAPPVCKWCSKRQKSAYLGLKAGLSDLAQASGSEFIDVSRNFEQDIDLSWDGIHLSAEGYVVLKQALEPVLLDAINSAETAASCRKQ